MGGRRGGSKGSFQTLVVPDLGLQGLRGLLHCGDRCQHLRQVLFQQLVPLGGGGVPFAAKPRKGLHLPNGHLGLAQAQQESDPFHVRRRITALAAGCAGYWRNQPGALVIAQALRPVRLATSAMVMRDAMGTILKVGAHSKSSGTCMTLDGACESVSGP